MIWSCGGVDPSEARTRRKQNLDRALQLIDMSCGRGGLTKIVLFPEFFLAGIPGRETAKEWIEKACIETPGEETDRFGEYARKYGVYVAGNAYAVDGDLPGVYFNTSFIIDPQGKIVSIYKRNHSSYCTTPGDIWDEFLEKKGYDSLFPVVESPLGRLACFPCGEINYPEVARMFRMKGAEVLLHPTGEPYGEHREGWEQARRTRAYENLCYLASINHGQLMSPYEANWRSHGGSEIIDFSGNVIARIDGVGEAMISGTIDIDTLRKRRGSSFDWCSSLKTEIFAPMYEKTHIYPVNTHKEKRMESLVEIQETKRKTTQALKQKGIL